MNFMTFEDQDKWQKWIYGIPKYFIVEQTPLYLMGVIGRGIDASQDPDYTKRLDLSESWPIRNRIADLYREWLKSPPESREADYFRIESLTADEFHVACNIWDLYLRLKGAITDGKLELLPTGRIASEALAEWIEIDNVPVSRSVKEVLFPRGHEPSEVKPLQNVTETPLMALIREGREYWWGGIDPEKQYRGTKEDIVDWFRKRGVSRPNAEAFKMAICPEWQSQGPIPKDKELVGKVSNKQQSATITPL